MITKTYTRYVLNYDASGLPVSASRQTVTYNYHDDMGDTATPSDQYLLSRTTETLQTWTPPDSLLGNKNAMIHWWEILRELIIPLEIVIDSNDFDYQTLRMYDDVVNVPYPRETIAQYGDYAIYWCPDAYVFATAGAPSTDAAIFDATGLFGHVITTCDGYVQISEQEQEQESTGSSGTTTKPTIHITPNTGSGSSSGKDITNNGQ